LLWEIHLTAPYLFGNPKVFTGNTKLRSEETGLSLRAETGKFRTLGLATADKEESAELHRAQGYPEFY
jgi:hypothetical protein